MCLASFFNYNTGRFFKPIFTKFWQIMCISTIKKTLLAYSMIGSRGKSVFVLKNSANMVHLKNNPNVLSRTLN